MRITNKIMQRNNLSNINTNKIYQDRLSTQMSTQKKISRPSEDPVVAIRSLRLRSNVNEITQYYSKNIPDASSWITITEDALSKMADVVSKMIGQYTRGSNSPFTTTDRGIVLEQLQLLSNEVYATGDADYAGRYVFTGYRTDTPLSFRTGQEQRYTLTEQLNKDALDSVINVSVGKVLEINSTNYESIKNADGSAITEDDISSTTVHRIRLAYKDCSAYDTLQARRKELMETLAGKIGCLKAADKDVNPASTFDWDTLDLGNLTDAQIQKIEETIAVINAKKADPAESVKTVSVPGTSIQIPGSTSISGGVIATLGEITTWGKMDIASLENWPTEWEALQEQMAGDMASPKIEFTDTDGKTHIWTGFKAEGAVPGAPVEGADGTVTEQGVITFRHSYDTNPTPYDYAAQNENAIVYVPETGEILLGAKRYETLMATKDSESTPTKNEAEIRVTYEKSTWLKGDLRPEHYFYCVGEKVDDAGKVVKDKDGNSVMITYNDTYLTENAERQVIEYDVGFNQSVRINSRADECFQHGIGREVEEAIGAMQDVKNLEQAQTDIEAIMKSLPDEDPKLAGLQKQLEAVKTALTYAKDKEQKLFERGITKLQKYLDDANLCVTACGARGSKLELIKNRTQNQKTTYETLKSENEDIDITEVAIQLNSAELTYNAALMAAGKVMKTTLLDFI